MNTPFIFAGLVIAPLLWLGGRHLIAKDARRVWAEKASKPEPFPWVETLVG